MTGYIGRFAPSPSGPLHFGSLISALASFLQSKSQGGAWHLRIDDVDAPRVVKESISTILQALDFYQLHWDGKTVYQSQHVPLYQDTLDTLATHVFCCQCTRKQLKGTPVYPGHCRALQLPYSNTSIRCLSSEKHIRFTDLCQGEQSWQLNQDCGDFILQRADGVFSYSFATVIDDDLLGVTEIIRGIDLLHETPKQQHLQQLLGYQTPSYGHLPLATNDTGQKLSKQSHAPALPLTEKSASKELYSALVFLGQQPDTALLDCNITNILAWGIKHWDIKKAAASDLLL